MSWPVWEWEGEGENGALLQFSIERNGPDHYWVTVTDADGMSMLWLPADVIIDMAGRVGEYARGQADFVAEGTDE